MRASSLPRSPFFCKTVTISASMTGTEVILPDGFARLGFYLDSGDKGKVFITTSPQMGKNVPPPDSMDPGYFTAVEMEVPTDRIFVYSTSAATTGTLYVYGFRKEVVPASGTGFPLLAPDGTYAAPSYSFATDPDLGLYRVGANSLGVAATTLVCSTGAGVAWLALSSGGPIVPTAGSYSWSATGYTPSSFLTDAGIKRTGAGGLATTDGGSGLGTHRTSYGTNGGEGAMTPGLQLGGASDGLFAASGEVDVISAGYTFLAVDRNGFEIATRPDTKIGWRSNSAMIGYACDTYFARAAAGIVSILGASAVGAALEFKEQTAPAAGAANTARLYAEDNGSGKTRLMVLFNSGAAQQVALEP